MASFLWVTIRRARRGSPQQPASPPGGFAGRPVRRTARAHMVAASAAALVVLLSVLATGAAPAGAGVRAGAPAQSAFQAAIQHIVNDGVPGAIGYERHGSQVTVTTSGLADLATQTPMAAGDRVRIGSVTKTFVATVVLQLVAEHRLALGDTIARWLPGLVPGGGGITVQELLQHTSGIYSYTSDPGFQQALQAHPTRVWQPAELVHIAVAHPPLFSPGTAFAYSNTDYILLGLIIQAEPLTCGTVWGHQGSFHGYYSVPFTTTDGSSQAVILVNADSGTLTRQQQTDIGNALITGICRSN